MTVARKYAGKKSMCPHCRQIFKVPDRSSDRRPDRPATRRMKRPARLCPSCKEKLAQDSKFCRQCGARVEVAVEPAASGGGGLSEKLAEAEREWDALREQAIEGKRARETVEQSYRRELQALHEENEALQGELRKLYDGSAGELSEQDNSSVVAGKMLEMENRLREMESLLDAQRDGASRTEATPADMEEYRAFMTDGERERQARPQTGIVDPATFEGAGTAPVRRSRRETGKTTPSHRDIRAIGLDFGTTNTLGSFYKGVAIRGIFQISRGEREGYRELVLPSTIGYLERENRFVIGYEAEDIPRRTIGFRKMRSIKRCLLCNGVDAQGRCANARNSHNHDICGQGMAPWRLGRRRFETEDIIAEYLTEVFRRIEQQYDVELTPEKINFTVPIYFGYVARKKLRTAIRLAFQHLRGKALETGEIENKVKLVHEPTAAAISVHSK